MNLLLFQLLLCITIVVIGVATSASSLSPAGVDDVGTKETSAGVIADGSLVSGSPETIRLFSSTFSKLFRAGRLVSSNAAFEGTKSTSDKQKVLQSSPSVNDVDTLLSGQRRSLFQENSTNSSCLLEDVVIFTSCTPLEYCTQLGERVTSGDVVSCNGRTNNDSSVYLNVTLASQENCIYFSAGVISLDNDPAPFDSARFDADFDLCYKETFSASFDENQSFSSFYKRTLDITRPALETFTQSFALELCNRTTTGYQGSVLILDGFCGTCKSAEIGNVACNSCQRCPYGSTSSEVDCTNIGGMGLQSSCGGMYDDAFVLPLGAYLGVVCTFSALVKGDCTLEQFCKYFQYSQDGITTCTGDVANIWSIKLDYEEKCYSTSYNATAEIDYCSLESITVHLEGETALTAIYHGRITQPSDSMGSVNSILNLVACDAEEAPLWTFDVGVCFEGCGNWSVGGMHCTSGCVPSCPDEQIFTCINVDPTLANACYDKSDIQSELFMQALVAYYKKVNSGETTATPTPPTAAPPIATPPKTASASTSTINFSFCKAIATIGLAYAAAWL
jgi:hypothetical protein